MGACVQGDDIQVDLEHRIDSGVAGNQEGQGNAAVSVKKQTDMPTVLIDRLVRERAKNTLKKFRGRAKPS